jgi:hypothetical protein
MLPIPGTSVAHLEENVAAAAVKLRPAAWKKIDALAGPVVAVRRWVVEVQGMKMGRILFSTFGRADRPVLADIG